MKIRIETDVKSKEKRRMKALKDCFNFYCKQHINYGKNVRSFDMLGDNLSNMAIGDWMVFNRGFGLIGKNRLDVKVSIN